MRRPKRTAQQREYEKAQRRLLTLKRAAVRVCVAEDQEDDDESAYQLAVTDLIAAAQRFALALPRAELRRLVK